MGNSVSKTKTFSVNLRNKINQTTGNKPETPSPHRTLVESDKYKDDMPTRNKTKPSILQNRSFFSDAKKTKMAKKPTSNRQNRQHASIKNTTLSRKKPKFKKKAIITKSIIGKPTNFKHLTCSKNYTNGMENDDEESSAMAAQMITLAALINPLPDMDPNKTLTPPVIPPRTSSYDNHIYIKQAALSLPSPLSPPSTNNYSSFSKEQYGIPSVSKKSKKKSKTKNYSSIKKGKKNDIKYASIGKGSITRNQVQHDKMPRQKRKAIKLEKAVNSLNL